MYNLHYEKFPDGSIKPIDVPYEYPSGWSLAHLSSITKLETGSIKRGPFGSAIKKDMFIPLADNAYKVYEQGNVIRKDLNYGEYYLDEANFKRLSSFEVISGDLLISCAGTIGETYSIPDKAPKGVINQALLRLRLNSDLLSNEFFQLMFKNQLDKIQGDAAGSAIKNLGSIQYLKTKLLWAIPPIKEQERILKKVSDLFALLDEIDKCQLELIQLSGQLKQKTLEIAMQGKLLSQDSTDEPASALLEKIREEKQQLYKEGKLKQKDLEESEIILGDDNVYYEKFKNDSICPIEVPYEIPLSWSWTRLRGAFKSISAGGDKPEEISYTKNNIFKYPIYSNGTKDNGLYGWSKEAKILEPSITISARGTIGFIAIRNQPFTPIIRLIAATALEDSINIDYLKYSLAQGLIVGVGTSIPQLTVPTIVTKLIPIAPYKEQLRIVVTIKKLFTEVEKISNYI